jgi:hypothetical protein
MGLVLTQAFMAQTKTKQNVRGVQFEIYLQGPV